MASASGSGLAARQPGDDTGSDPVGVTARADDCLVGDGVSATLGPDGRAAWMCPGQPESVRLFRQLARAVAADDGQGDTAALCVSELVTNALVHSRSGLPGGTVTVCFEALRGGGALRIEVHDDGARVPAAARPDTGLPGAAESGYGLSIVAAVAADWGVTAHADGRSLTWCIIPGAGSQR